MTAAAIDALSPIDGRYRNVTDALRPFLSEGGLIRERIRVEARWLLHLARAVPKLAGAALGRPVEQALGALASSPPPNAAQEVKRIEGRINHDVKAVEYYVREQLAAAGASEATLELVHFGCTSEDINNVSYARLLLQSRAILQAPLGSIIDTLAEGARASASVVMLARTHGQPASPTSLGKEMANVVARMRRAQVRWNSVQILGKWNGAVGNFNAHVSAVPEADWLSISSEFLQSLELSPNRYTTQIEPHDWIAEYCDAVAAVNVILTDLCRDFWGYIALGYLVQRAIPGEVGSSTMPHKVNPIDFENAEGNFGIANALFRHFSEKLPVSRWQRDLTDSTVLRNLGSALAHSLVGWTALLRGLSKVAPAPERIALDVSRAWEVLGEAIQTSLRAHGIANGYELLKDFSRGKSVDAASVAAFIDTLPLPQASRESLKRLTPDTYCGLSARLASEI